MGGLDIRPLAEICRSVAAMGFTVVRLPFSGALSGHAPLRNRCRTAKHGCFMLFSIVFDRFRAVLGEMLRVSEVPPGL